MANKPDEDPVMAKVRDLFQRSGLTLAEMGEKMGYAPALAKQSVWQLMRSGDPRIGTLRRFADAVGIPVEQLLVSRKKPRAEK